MGGSRWRMAYVCAFVGLGSRKRRWMLECWILKSTALPLSRRWLAKSSMPTLPRGATRETESNSAMASPVAVSTSHTSIRRSDKRLAPVSSGS